MKKGKALFAALIVSQSLSAQAAETVDQRFQQCAIDLCGTAKQQSRLQGKAFENPSWEERAFLKVYVEPVLQSALDQTWDNKKTEFAMANKFFTSSPSELNHAQKSLLVTSYFMKLHIDEIIASITSPDGRLYQIDQSKLQTQIPSLSAQEAVLATELFNNYFKSSYFKEMRHWEGIKFDIMMDHFSMRASDTLKEYLSLGKYVSFTFGMAFEKNLQLPLLKKAIENRSELSESEKESIVEGITTINQFMAMMENSVTQVALKYPLNIEKVLIDYRWEKRFNDFSHNEADRLAQMKKSADTCNTSITKLLAASPSELRQRQFNKLLEQVKNSAIKSLPLYFSGESLEKTAHHIRILTWILPNTVEQNKAKVLQLLKNHSKNEELHHAKLTSQDLSTADTASFALRALIEGFSAKEKDSAFAAVDETCKQLKAPTINDAAFYAKNKVVVSWQSVMYPEYGVGTAAHELGHIVDSATAYVSDRSSMADFVQARTCSNISNARLHAGKKSATDLYQYLDEDWGDMFAATVMKDVAQVWNHSKNYSCALIAVDTKDDLYSNLTLTSPSGADTHSMSLTRVLRTQIAAGKSLPASCETALTAKEKTILGEACSK
jgi:hypothetical protein